ncbi:unnamed protein product, partial [Polarella glacialis]
MEEPLSPPRRAKATEEDVRREIAELRTSVGRESSERCRIEAFNKRTLERLEECEAQVAGTTTSLEETRSERGELRKQLQEKSEKQVELSKKLRRQQELSRSLEDELLKAETVQQELEKQVRDDLAARRGAQAEAAALRDRLRELEQSVLKKAPALLALGRPDSEAQMQQLREQFEETLRALQRQHEPAGSHSSSPGEEEAELPSVEHQLLDEWSNAYDAPSAFGWASASSTGSLATGAAAVPALPPPARPVAVAGGTLRSPRPNRARGGELPAESPISAKDVLHSPTPSSGVQMSPGSGDGGRGERLNISLRDLSEIKALKKPPPPIRMLME